MKTTRRSFIKSFSGQLGIIVLSGKLLLNEIPKLVEVKENPVVILTNPGISLERVFVNGKEATFEYYFLNESHPVGIMLANGGDSLNCTFAKEENGKLVYGGYAFKRGEYQQEVTSPVKENIDSWMAIASEDS